LIPPQVSEDEMAKEVKSRLEVLGFRVERDKYGNVIGKLDGKGEPLMLNAHIGYS
jgi:putative aminopeptidase FrvX